jgi:hypothetical protein
MATGRAARWELENDCTLYERPAAAESAALRRPIMEVVRRRLGEILIVIGTRLQGIAPGRYGREVLGSRSVQQLGPEPGRHTMAGLPHGTVVVPIPCSCLCEAPPVDEDGRKHARLVWATEGCRSDRSRCGAGAPSSRMCGTGRESGRGTPSRARAVVTAAAAGGWRTPHPAATSEPPPRTGARWPAAAT